MSRQCLHENVSQDEGMRFPAELEQLGEKRLYGLAVFSARGFQVQAGLRKSVISACMNLCIYAYIPLLIWFDKLK